MKTAKLKTAQARQARVVALLKAAEMLSNREIARATSVSDKTVARLRREHSARAESTPEVRRNPDPVAEAFDPAQVLEEIARDGDAPASARVAAARELRRTPRDPANTAASPADALAARASAILSRNRSLN